MATAQLIDLADEICNALRSIAILPRRLVIDTQATDSNIPQLRGVWGAALYGLEQQAYHAVFRSSEVGRLPAYLIRPSRFAPGEPPAIEWISFGRAVDYDEILLRAWDVASGMGLGKLRTPFYIRQRIILAVDGRPAALGTPWTLGDVVWPLEGYHPSTTSCRLLFTTPLSLLREGRLIEQPTFTDLIVRSCRRLGGFLPTELHDRWEELKGRAISISRQIAHSTWEGDRLDLRRYSGSQKRDLQIPGVRGWLDLPQGPGPLWPLLAATTWLHVGKSTNVGLGQLEVLPCLKDDEAKFRILRKPRHPMPAAAAKATHEAAFG